MGKAYEDYTISDIHRLNLSFMKKNRTPEEIANMSSNLAYLIHMSASMNNSELMYKSFLEVFDRDTFYKLTKGDMNKALHDLTTQLAQTNQILAKSPVQLATLTDEIDSEHSALAETGKDELEARATNTQDRADRLIAEANSRYNSYLHNLENLKDIQSELDAIHEQIDNYQGGTHNTRLINSIKEVIADGAWQYYGYKKDIRIACRRGCSTGAVSVAVGINEGTTTKTGFMFVSTNNIICQNYNPAAGVKQEVDFGRLAIWLDKDGGINGARFVFDYMKNYNTQHPHLSGDSFCWGSAYTQYNHLFLETNPNFAQILGLIKVLMETYCPDNPYTSLNSFSRIRKNRVTNAIDMRSLPMWPRDIIPDDMHADYDALVAENKIAEGYLNQTEEETPEQIRILELANKQSGQYASEHSDWYYSQSSPRRIKTAPASMTALMLTKEECLAIVGRPWDSIIDTTDRTRAFIVHCFSYHDLLVGAKLQSINTEQTGEFRTVTETVWHRDSSPSYTNLTVEGMGGMRCYKVKGILAVGGTDESTN